MGRHEENINCVPAGTPNINDAERTVYIAFRAMFSGTQGVVEKYAGAAINFIYSLPPNMPNPNYHWGVIVGDYVHQLEATTFGIQETGWNFYKNEKLSPSDTWKKFEAGKTRFNDAALVSAGTQAIESMPEEYHIIYNNCQTFTLRLADLICRNGRRKVYTTWSRNNLQIGFVPGQEQGNEDKTAKEVEVAYVENGEAQSKMLELIDEIMLKHTPDITPEDLEKGNIPQPGEAETK